MKHWAAEDIPNMKDWWTAATDMPSMKHWWVQQGDAAGWCLLE